MDEIRLKNIYRRDNISFSCFLVAAVFFLVLSQFIILRLPEIVTQVFRPAIVLSLLIKAQREKIAIAVFPARKYALWAALYCGMVLLLNSINADEVRSAIASILYLLMFVFVTGIRWNAREIKFIIAAVFAATFACAIVVMLSNPMTDLSYAANNEISMFGILVNRNKNAYAFSIGTAIGVIYLVKGRNLPKALIFIVTIPIVYCLLYSQCRGAFVCAVAATVIVVGSDILEERKRNTSKFLLNASLFLLLCVAAYLIIKNSELKRLVDGANLSGRDDGIKYAWQLFLNGDLFSKIFGHGFMYESNNTVGAISHLVYTQYALSTGIIGVSIIIMMLVSTGCRIKSSVSYAFFFIAFLRTFFESLDYYIFIPLILSIIVYTYTSSQGITTDKLFTGRDRTR